MNPVRRLVTVVDVGRRVDPARVDVARDTSASFDCLHLAELDDGRRVVLLDDRGWSSSGPPGVWRFAAPHVEESARTVVGPDEPPDGVSYDDEARQHFGDLASRLAAAGVVVTGEELQALPHDVELTDRLRTLLG